MVVISVLYPYADGSRFDLDYYLKKHMPLVQSRWGSFGLQGAQVLRGSNSGDGGQPTYQVMTNLTFSSAQDFQKAAAEHGPELFGDVPNFTNAQPIVQISEPVS